MRELKIMIIVLGVTLLWVSMLIHSLTIRVDQLEEYVESKTNE